MPGNAGDRAQDVPAPAESLILCNMVFDLFFHGTQLAVCLIEALFVLAFVETLKEIERAYAKALGFEDHQRVVGAHTNTDNFHLHVGYNKIHPKTGNVHTPFRDFKALAEVSMAVEQKYGLATDYGRAPEKTHERTRSADRRPAQTPESAPKPEGKANTRAKDYEAFTWESPGSPFPDLIQQGRIPSGGPLAVSKVFRGLARPGFGAKGVSFPQNDLN